MTLFHTGARPTELLKVRLFMVDLSNDNINFDKDITKTGVARIVPINQYLKALLINMNLDSSGVTAEHITYSRYEEGYKFIDEQEWRLVKSIDNLYLPFTEEDVFAIVVPNKDFENIVLNTLKKCWKKLPRIIEYPN